MFYIRIVEYDMKARCQQAIYVMSVLSCLCKRTLHTELYKLRYYASADQFLDLVQLFNPTTSLLTATMIV